MAPVRGHVRSWMFQQNDGVNFGGLSVTPTYRGRTGLTLNGFLNNEDASILPSCRKLGVGEDNTFVNFTEFNISTGTIEFYIKPSAYNTRGHLGDLSNSYIKLVSTTQIRIRVSGAAYKNFTVSEMTLNQPVKIKLQLRVDTNIQGRVFVDDVESADGEQDMNTSSPFVVKYMGYADGGVAPSFEAYWLKVTGDVQNLEVYFNGLGIREFDASGTGNLGVCNNPSFTYTANGSQYYLDSGYSVYEKTGELNEYLPYGTDASTLVAAGYSLVRTFTGSTSFLNMGEISELCLIDFDPDDTEDSSLDVFDKDNTTYHIASGSMDYYDASYPYRWRADEICRAQQEQTYFNWAYDRFVYCKVESEVYGNTRAVTRMDEIINFSRQLSLSEDAEAQVYCGTTGWADFFDLLENVVTVKQDGSGDYLTIQAAIDGIADAAIDKQYRVDIYDNFTVTELADFAEISGSYHWYFSLNSTYIYLNGVGARKKITCSIPETATDSQTTYYEPCNIDTGRTGMKNLEISMRNGRYAIHVDFTATELKLKDCKFINYSTQEVIDYRIANSQSYSGVYSGQTAFGSGTGAGENWLHENCEFVALIPYSVHSNDDFVSPCTLKYDSCTFTSMAWYQANVNPSSTILHNFALNCLTSEQDNPVLMQHNEFNDYLQYQGSYYDTDEADIFPINDFKVTNYWTTLPFENEFNSGGSLRITSASGAGSVSITGGTAEDLIIPSADEALNYATGQMEVGDAWARNANTALGIRLGDCSGVSKDLQMSIDGGGTTTVTFDEDFTAQDNTYVIAFINTALAGAAIASVYQTAQDYEPTLVT